ncbi:MAG: hypothetical protein ACI9UA_004752 [Pseudoalteromonas tetraodonis]|jgi:hypothetical protein
MNHRHVATALTLLLVSSLIAGNNPTQDEKKSSLSIGKIEVGRFKVSGFTIGKRIAIDADYGKQHQFPVAAPYNFIIPKRKNIFVLHPPKSGQASIKLNFATEDKQLVENLQFVNMRIPVEAPEKRIAMTADLIIKKSLPTAFRGFAQSKHLETYQHKIGKCDAVTVHGEISDPKKGRYYVKLTGIINPESIDSVLAFSMINQAQSDIDTLDKLRSEGLANKVIHSLKFQNEPKQKPQKTK